MNNCSYSDEYYNKFKLLRERHNNNVDDDYHRLNDFEKYFPDNNSSIGAILWNISGDYFYETLSVLTFIFFIAVFYFL